MRLFCKFSTFLLVTILSSPIFAQSQSAMIGVPTDLYSKPDKTSAVQTQLAEGTTITIHQRQGNWYQISSEGSSDKGWVRSYFVQKQSSEGWLQRMKRFMRGDNPAHSTAMATIGIRGLGPGDVKKAQPDPAELKKLESFKQDINAGLAYASSAPLKSQEISYLQANHVAESNKGLLNKSTDTIGDVADGVGKSLGGAVKGLKGLFGGKKDDE